MGGSHEYRRAVQVYIPDARHPIHIADNTSGIISTGKKLEFSPTKLTIIADTVQELLARMDGQPLSQAGREHYTTHLERRAGIRKVEVDDSKEYFHDNAEFYRGMLLGDIVIAALVTDGQIISGGNETLAGTRVTNATGEAVAYPDAYTGTTHQDGTVTPAITSSYIADALHIPADQVAGSVLMSPVIARFKKGSLSDKTHDQYPIIYPEYWFVHPAATIADLTDACVADIAQWSVIHVKILREQVAAKEKALHVAQK